MTIKRRNHGSGHSYWDVDAAGNETKIQSVTKILDNTMPKGGLMSWYAEQAALEATDRWDELAQLPIGKRYDAIKKAPWSRKTAAAAKGTKIHNLAEPLAHGREVEVPEEHAAFVASCVAFLNEWEPVTVRTETTVVHRGIPYAGTFDAVFRMRGHCWLADWKTGKGVYGEAALQLAAYRHAEHFIGEDGAEHPMAELGIDRAAVIHLRSDGYDVYPVETGDSAFLAFRHAAWLSRLLDSQKDERGNFRSKLDDFLLPRISA